MTFFSTLQNNFNFYLYSIEELLLILFLFSIIKLVILCIIMELIWPTHFFNRRHCISFYNIKLRDFQSVFLKLKPKTKTFYYIMCTWHYYYYKC